MSQGPIQGFPSSSAGKESTCNAGDPTSIPRSGSSPGKGIGYRSIILGFFGGSDDKESACNVGDLGSISGQEASLEKGMAIYFSILPWRIPWTEEPGGLQSMRVTKSQREL